MGLSLSQLIAPTTVAEAEAEILGLLAGLGFSADSWQPKSVPRTFTKAFATLYSDLTFAIAEIAKGGFLGLASELKNADGSDKVDWLDLHAESQYDEVRSPAASTEGTMILTNSSGSPHTIAVGELYAADSAGRRFNNTTGGTLSAPNGSTLSLTWKAEAPGAVYNIPNESILPTLATPIPGVAVTNPADPLTGSWITVAGSDVESNGTYASRARAKWATLGTGAGAAAYVAWAKKGAPTVTRVLVDDANPDGAGTIRVYLANASGPALPAEVSAADSYIQPRRALTAKVTTVAATPKPVTVTATLTVKSAYSALAPGQAAANLTALAEALEIGDDVYLSEIITALSSPTGVQKVALAAPAADVTVGPHEIVTFTLNLTTVIV